MLTRVLEPEVMDSAAEASEYDAMDHTHVNQVFVNDFLQLPFSAAAILDVGTGTAQIPIELCRRQPGLHVVAIDMAQHMLRVGQHNLERAALTQCIRLQECDAKHMPFADGTFAAVISNSIVHHIPEPRSVLAEMARVVKAQGLIFVRDLLRPADMDALRKFVLQYAGDANAHQQQMFADSLHAALTLDEVQELVERLDLRTSMVEQTSDRHWTWVARK